MKTTSKYFLASIATVCFVLCMRATHGQRPALMEEDLERLKAHKIALITDKLRLTPDEAQVFWPVYNQHERQREEELKSFREKYRYEPEEIPGLTEAEANTFIDAHIDHEQRLLDMRKEYHVELKKVLPPKKIMVLYGVENEFRKELIRRLGEIRERKKDERRR